MSLGKSLLILFIGCACIAADGPKRGMRPEDSEALEGVDDPHISPDGRLVAYTMSSVDAQRSRRVSNIWMTRADGSEQPWQFTRAESSSHARWSPDGKMLAVLSNRPSADAPTPARNQVFLLPMNGGEAVRLTDFANGAIDFAWSPDGKQLACVTKTDSHRGKTTTDVRHYTGAIYKFDGAGWYDEKHSHIWIFDLNTRKSRQITSGDSHEDTQPRWAPDGKRIVYVSQDSSKYPGTGGSVWVVAAAGGEPLKISDQDGLARSPAWSEDGSRIAYVSTPNDWDDARIWLASPDRAGSKLASRQLDIIPVDLGWTTDGSILFSAMEKGSQQLFRMDPGSGSITPLTSGDIFIQAQEGDNKNQRIVYVRADTTHVGDLFIAGLDGRDAKQLSHANAKLYGELQLQSAERLHYPAADGFTVEEFLMKPVDWQPGKSYPMILCIHGGPGGMWSTRFYHEFQMLAAHGWAVLFVNPRGSSGYGQKFQRAVEKQWGGKAYDDLMRGVDYAIEENPWIDRQRLGVRGGSFGGFMTNWIVGHTDRFTAAVTTSSISNFTSVEGTRDMAYSHSKDFGGDLFENFNFYWDQSPLKYAKNVKTPTLVMHGDSDGRVPIEQGEQWFRALQHFHVPSEFVVFPRENHNYGVDPKHRVELSKWEVYWFERYLNGNKSYPAPDTE